MQGAKIRVGARLGESERKPVVGIHRFGAEDLSFRCHRVRNVVVIDPGDGIAGIHRDLLRVEGKVVDFHLNVGGADLPCCKGAGDQDRCAKRENSLQVHARRSALQRGVDDGEALLAGLEGDAGGAEQAAQLLGRNLHRPG
jgi:hypothetical protein